MNKDIAIYDKFLDDFEYLSIHDILMGRNFPWYYQNTVVNPSDDEKNDLDTYQFVHLFFSVHDGGVCSNHYDLLKPLLSKLGAKTILKIKCNLLTKNENPKYFEYHRDFIYPSAKTAIYYINTNNGSTIFKDGTEIQSIQNRMVVFDNSMLHTGKSCSDESVRVLINFNYFDY